jgi:hypothetical protein
MRIPATLRTAALIAMGAVALALIVATLPAHPAFADDLPPPPATRTPGPTGPVRIAVAKPDPTVYGQASNPDYNGHFQFVYAIKNIGLVVSQPVFLYTYCTYPVAGSVVDEVAAAPLKILQPMAPKGTYPGLVLDCAPRYGQSAVAARVMILSVDDGNTNNNEATAHK